MDGLQFARRSDLDVQFNKLIIYQEACCFDHQRAGRDHAIDRVAVLFQWLCLMPSGRKWAAVETVVSHAAIHVAGRAASRRTEGRWAGGCGA
jgi:hypothetical protein